MQAPNSSAQTNTNRTMYLWLGVVLLVVGLACHVLAARAIGGSYIAYRDHLVGFVVLTFFAGALLAVTERKFWRGRHDLTLFVLGAVQTSLGVFVYIERFSVHG